MKSRLKRKLQENLSLSTKLFLKEAFVIATDAAKTVVAAPRNLGRKVVNLAGRAGIRVPRILQSKVYDLQAPTIAAPVSDFPRSLIAQKRAARRLAQTDIKTSIIIPVFNKAAFTSQCLHALLQEINFNETEIIVVDNASSDDTPQLLAQFGDLLVIIRNEENRGFVDSCNQGAAAAQGKYLVFLNNDTTVLPGWLDHLVDTVERDATVGAVGSMFLYPDGSIQEAGAIVWKTGEAHHYGWGGSPDDRRFVFSREADYCSAASLLIRKEIFQSLGGFDRRYSPAYYEDVDLCFGVRALGYKVMYQPQSRLVHYEGATAGRDVAKGVKHFQILNREKFVEKWRQRLELEHYGKDPRHVLAASRRNCLPNLIVFDERVPTPDRDAGSGRMFMILKALTKWSNVVFVAFHRPHGIDYEEALWKEGIETADATQYRALLKTRHFRAAVVSRPSVADAMIPRIRRMDNQIKIVFDMVDAHFIRLQREHEIGGNRQTSEDAKRYQELEIRLARTSDLIWCNSSEDKRMMEQAVPGKPIEVIPTIHAIHGPGKSFEDRQDLLFVGNLAHRPNSDAIHYLMREIHPLISERLPNAKLFIVGDNAAEISVYASERVFVTGYLPNIDDYWEGCRVFLAPLRFGAGVKGKIGGAMSHGLPVVTTSMGAEGFGLSNKINVMIADNPNEFADAVCELYSSRELWQSIAQNSREHIKRNFTLDLIAETINGSIQQVTAASVAEK